MLLQNVFHTDHDDHEQVPFTSEGFPYACIHTLFDHYPDQAIPWHWHTPFEFTYVEQGTLNVKTPDLEIDVPAGSTVFINADVLHAYRSVGDVPCVTYAHLFDMPLLSGAYHSVFEEKYFLPVSRCAALQAWMISPNRLEGARLSTALLESVELTRDEPEGYEFGIRSRLSESWRVLFNETKEARRSATARCAADTERLKQMLQFIESNYSDSLSVGEIAASAGISIRESNRCFRRCIDSSPIEYLTNYRLRMAAEALSTTSRTVTEISFSCGFSSPGYFGKMFLKSYGMTPKAFQKKAALAE